MKRRSPDEAEAHVLRQLVRQLVDDREASAAELRAALELALVMAEAARTLAERPAGL